MADKRSRDQAEVILKHNMFDFLELVIKDAHGAVGYHHIPGGYNTEKKASERGYVKIVHKDLERKFTQYKITENGLLFYWEEANNLNPVGYLKVIKNVK